MRIPISVIPGLENAFARLDGMAIPAADLALFIHTERVARIVATAGITRNACLLTEPVSALLDTEVRIVAKYVLTTLTARIVHKNVSARMAPLVHQRMADATVQQVIIFILDTLINTNDRTVQDERRKRTCYLL